MEAIMEDLLDRILRLKKERDAVILAHYYVDEKVQALADYVGDSYYLSKIASTVPQKVILFCGVSFMGESAKILNPKKTIIMPDRLASCPMAHMADIEEIRKVRQSYNDLAVVCYINSTAEIKAQADVCVTSSNAVSIVKAILQKNIYFIPDANLGWYVKEKVPEKNIILHDGYCHVHTGIRKEDIEEARKVHPGAKVLVHPECTMDVLDMADYIGSTAGIIHYATESKNTVFIICTEKGVLYKLQQKNPGKIFYFPGHSQICPNMKRITAEKVLDALENMHNQIEMHQELLEKANHALSKMLTIAK
jgi:quinolinate synthase